MGETAIVFKFLVNNLAIMFTMSLFYGFVIRRNTGRYMDQIIFGIFFGLAVIAAMLNSYRLENGPIFDCRSVILSVSGMFAGPAALLPMVVAVVYRFWLGGIGAVTGILVAISSTLIGIVFFYARKKRSYLIGGWYLYATGLLVHIIMTLLMLILPHKSMLSYFENIALPVIVLYPIATVIFSRIMLHQEKISETEAKIVAANLRLSELNNELENNKEQLQAANQQLTASGQQLRAANQQLSATNQQLRANEAELQWLARFPSEAPNPILRIISDGSIIYNNTASIPLLESWNCRLSNKLGGKWHNSILQACNTGKIDIIEHNCGKTIYMLTIVPVPGYDYVNVYGMDITALKNAEKALKESENILNITSDIAKIGGWQFDPKTRKGTWTRQTAIIHDLEPDSPTSVDFGLKFYQGESATMIKKAVDEAISNGTRYDLELEILTALNRRKWVRTVGIPQLKDGRVINIYGFIQDVTELHKARELMEQYNRKLEKEVQEQTARLSEKNRQLEKEIADRINAEQVLRTTQSQLVESEKMVSIGRLAAGIAHELNTPLGAIGSTNTTLKTSVRSITQKSYDVYRLPDDYIKTLNKIIDRLLLNNNQLVTTRQRRQYIKEINDNLCDKGLTDSEEIALFLVEVGLLDNYDDYLPFISDAQGKELRDYLSKIANIIQGLHIIDSAINQSSRIAYALREYARTNDNSEPELIDLRKTLETAIILYGNKIKHGIDLTVNFADVPQISGFSNELCQVWTNLIHNAVQAMDGTGQMEITLEQQDKNIMVAIKDSGCGIPQENLDKIFDPLFTTKPVGIGTGLGLDIARRIINRHKGDIQVKSKPGKGTVFTVTLPIST